MLNFIPGFINIKSDYAAEIALSKEPINFIHQKGRKESYDSIDSNFSFLGQYDFIVKQIIRDKNTVIIGDSMGATFATKYASEFNATHLVLLDFFPKYNKLNNDWLNKITNIIEDRIDLKTINLLIEQSNDIEFANTIDQIMSPILFIRGGKSKMIKYSDQELYLMNPNISVVTIPEVGHNVFGNNPSKIWDTINAFVKHTH